MRFRKKPVVIEAKQFKYEAAYIDELKLWMGPAMVGYGKDRHPDAKGWLHISTLEDGHKGSPHAKHIATEGDWIIQGVQGEFYPCKPDIFAATYEEAK